jgi:hypothetical protein
LSAYVSACCRSVIYSIARTARRGTGHLSPCLERSAAWCNAACWLCRGNFLRPRAKAAACVRARMRGRVMNVLLCDSFGGFGLGQRVDRCAAVALSAAIRGAFVSCIRLLHLAMRLLQTDALHSYI